MMGLTALLAYTQVRQKRSMGVQEGLSHEGVEKHQRAVGHPQGGKGQHDHHQHLGDLWAGGPGG